MLQFLYINTIMTGSWGLYWEMLPEVKVKTELARSLRWPRATFSVKPEQNRSLLYLLTVSLRKLKFTWIFHPFSWKIKRKRSKFCQLLTSIKEKWRLNEVNAVSFFFTIFQNNWRHTWQRATPCCVSPLSRALDQWKRSKSRIALFEKVTG